MSTSSRSCRAITCIPRRVSSIVNPSSRPRNESVVCTNYSSGQLIFRYRSTANYSVTAGANTSSLCITDDDLLSRENAQQAIKTPALSTKTHRIYSGIILSRPPLLTPNLHPFEKAFFFYQKRLNERLAIPFTRYFYFKKDTPANTDWKIKFQQRGGVTAKELGAYNAYSKDAWNDELLVKEKHMVEPEYVIDQLVKDSCLSVTEDGVVVQDEAARAQGVEKPRPRTTDADEKMDIRRLDRALDRTLYLVVREKVTDQWVFPSGEVLDKENLYSAAERVLAESCGINMNTWIVGRTPIAHQICSPSENQQTNEGTQACIKSKVTFFMKGRIMAGQANLVDNHFNLDDYRWLAKDEISQLISSDLFRCVSNTMPER